MGLVESSKRLIGRRSKGHKKIFRFGECFPIRFVLEETLRNYEESHSVLISYRGFHSEC